MTRLRVGDLLVISVDSATAFVEDTTKLHQDDFLRKGDLAVFLNTPTPWPAFIWYLTKLGPRCINRYALNSAFSRKKRNE